MQTTHWFLLKPGDYLMTSHPGHGWMSMKTCTDGTRALTICRPDQSLAAVNRRLSSRISRPIAVFAVVLALAMQIACLTTHGVVVDDRTGWVDEDDVRLAVEMVFGDNYWTEASPALEIMFVTTRSELSQMCAGRTDVNGCYHGRYSTFGDPPDIIAVLLPEYDVCLVDAGYSVFVHELVHRWQYEHGYPSGHPQELFGDDQHGGMTGEIECELAESLCPWYAELSQLCN